MAETEAEAETEAAAAEPDAFPRLLQFFKDTRRLDFTGYKTASLQRRTRKRMEEVGQETWEAYLDYLQVHPEEFPQLFDRLLINVTGFFREPAAWQFLAEHVIPDLLADLGPDEPIRVWTAGCASGEEAYSIVMSFAEALGPVMTAARLKVYATDLDDDALLQARQAVYPARSVEAVPPALVDRYFEPQAGGFAFHPDLRRTVVFGRHDLVQDAPISRVSLLTCRNTLMYFNAETQARVLERFHFALRERGYLLLGKAEMLLSTSPLFTAVDLKQRIFRTRPHATIRERLATLADPVGVAAAADDVTADLPAAAFQWNPVPEIVVDEHGTLVLANQRAMAFADLTPADLGRPFAELEMSYRPLELRSVIEQVASDRRTLTIGDVTWPRGTGNATIDVVLTPVLHDARVVGVSLQFDDVSARQQLQQRLEVALREARTASEALQSSTEELETTNEELQSTVEEQETTNEELQSTNEELETTNEELQSTNEELVTLNDELRDRTLELTEVTAFMESILAGMSGAVVVVDGLLVVRVWTSRAEDLWGLRPEEAQGTSFFGLDIGLPVDALRNPLRRSLSGQADDVVTLDATNRKGRRITCEVRCSPLLSAAGDRRGVILLMDVTEAR